MTKPRTPRAAGRRAQGEGRVALVARSDVPDERRAREMEPHPKAHPMNALLMRILRWVLRLFAWPWVARSLMRWPTAPQELTVGTDHAPMGERPRGGGLRMGFDTATLNREAGNASASLEVTR